MSASFAAIGNLVEEMLGMVDASAPKVSRHAGLTVSLGGTTIVFDGRMTHPFERLAVAIEARLAFERATAMIAAAGANGVPLWLVVGPDTLASWLDWSRLDGHLAAALKLNDDVTAAPIAGQLVRRARRDLGQLAARVRVLAGEAVAESIEFSHRVTATAVFGRTSRLVVVRQALPETVLTALSRAAGSNEPCLVSALVDHPFFAVHDFVATPRNEDGSLVIELATIPTPLAPIPRIARSAVPPNADPVFPWRATRLEVASLYALVRQGEALLAR